MRAARRTTRTPTAGSRRPALTTRSAFGRTWSTGTFPRIESYRYSPVGPKVPLGDRSSEGGRLLTTLGGPLHVVDLREKAVRGDQRPPPQDLHVHGMVPPVGRVPDGGVGGIDPIANPGERRRSHLDGLGLPSVRQESRDRVDAGTTPLHDPVERVPPLPERARVACMAMELLDHWGETKGRVRSSVEEDRSRADLHREFARLPAQELDSPMALEPEYGTEGALHPLGVAQPQDGR